MKCCAKALWGMLAGIAAFSVHAIEPQPPVAKVTADLIFMQADKNHDGKLNPSEFAEYKKLQEEKLIAQIKRNVDALQFSAFDKDGDHEISQDELKAARIEARQKMMQKMRERQERFKAATHSNSTDSSGHSSGQ